MRKKIQDRIDKLKGGETGADNANNNNNEPEKPSALKPQTARQNALQSSMRKQVSFGEEVKVAR